VDPNRNFDFHWGGSRNNCIWNQNFIIMKYCFPGENVSDPCSLTYPGVSAFSEKESSAIGTQLLAQSEKIILYLAIHSYGEVSSALALFCTSHT
jgi:Zinc carboxypeptidase